MMKIHEGRAEKKEQEISDIKNERRQIAREQVKEVLRHKAMAEAKTHPPQVKYGDSFKVVVPEYKPRDGDLNTQERDGGLLVRVIVKNLII